MTSIHRVLHRFHNHDAGIFLVRLALAAAFIHAGWLKVTNIDMVVTGFASIGLTAFFAYLVAYCELIAGLAFLVGIFVRYAGVVTSIIMIVAISKVHLANGFGLQNGGYEYTLILLCLSLAMITFGAGAYSWARLLRSERH